MGNTEHKREKREKHPKPSYSHQMWSKCSKLIEALSQMKELLVAKPQKLHHFLLFTWLNFVVIAAIVWVAKLEVNRLHITFNDC
jgi:hypothetical protein